MFACEQRLYCSCVRRLAIRYIFVGSVSILSNYIVDTTQWLILWRPLIIIRIVLVVSPNHFLLLLLREEKRNVIFNLYVCSPHTYISYGLLLE